MRLISPSVLTCVLVLSVGACGTEPSATGEQPPELRAEWLTGAALAAYDSTSGLFALPAPELDPGERSEPDIVAIGDAFGGFYAGAAGGGPEDIVHEHSGPIHFAALRVCGRHYYQRSLFAPNPDAPNFVRNAFGAQWFVWLCEPGKPPAMAGWIAANTGIVVRDGELEFPHPIHGNEEFLFGVPPEGLIHFVTPERAATIAHRLTGLRVSDVPRAEGDFYYISDPPPCARWRVALEAPITARGDSTGQVRSTAEIFVPLFPCYRTRATAQIPRPEQPADVVSRYRTYTGPFGEPYDSTLERADSTRMVLVRPLAFESFTVVRP